MRNLIKYVVCLLLICETNASFAQSQEANVWYFGRWLGLDFNSGVAIPLNDGQVYTTEGVATICNSNGDLLFYTDGITIWNRFHQIMPNGTGLFGNESSTQSAVIVPVIGDPLRYYVFTVDQLSGPRGLTYSIVNMSLDGGKGDVETKNVSLQSNVVEKITAVRHCNNRDVWVVAHGSVSNIYYSFLVSPTGINSPVLSNTGTVLPGIIPPGWADSSSLGYLKASPDGKRIAAAHWNVNVDVSDFNNATGVVSNSYSLFQPFVDPHYLAYGVEFSPDSRLLYTTVFYKELASGLERNALFQYDVTLATPTDVKASKQVISQNSDGIQTYAALQIAPDGKVYMAKNTYKHLASINNPNVYGSGCNYVSNAVQWTGAGQSSSFGLPTFVQSYFYPIDSFTYVVNCPGLSVNFYYTVPQHVTSVKWDFGDPASGANNTSTLNNPVHVFSAPGIYNVELIKFTNCGSDTLRKLVSTSGLILNLGPDTLVCGGTSVLLNSAATGSTNSYLWQDGSTNPTFLAITAGLYWVQVSNVLGCNFRDSINVNFKPKPVYSLGNDTTICQNDTLTLNATVTGATSYLWSTGATSPTIKAFQPALYWCDVNKDGCYFRDSININVVPSPAVNLGSDIATCGSTPITLDATNPNCTYLWQNGTTNSTFNVTASGLYWVEVRNTNGCKTRDSINIAFNSIPIFNLGADRSICQGDTLTLNASVASAVSYLWSTGAASPTIRAFQAGTYWCEVNNGCIFRDTIVITAVLPSPTVNLGADISICGTNPQALDAANPGSTYLWQDGSTNQTYTVTNSGTYWAQVTSSNGCSMRDSIQIIFNPYPIFNLGPDTDICQGTSALLNATVSGALNYLWNTGSTTPTINVSVPGLYWCEVMRNGCLFRDSLTITGTKPNPVVNLGNDVSVCEEVVVSLDATYPGATYLWQDGSTNPIYNVTTPGTYSVEVNLNGCKNSDTVRISHQLKPKFTLGPDQVVCPGNPLVLTPALNPTWQLSWEDGSTSPTHTISEPGQYSLSAINNCGSTTDDIIVSKGVCKVFMPSAFTPNNDGLNDYFKALGTETVTKFELKIFNRWGELVFHTTNKSAGWNGKLSGVEQSSAVYVYVVQYVDINSPQPQTLKGTLTLIR